MDSPHLICSLHETGADFLFLQRKISKKDEDMPRFVGHIRKEASRLVVLIDDIIRLS